MISAFILPFMLATFWATLGCLVVRGFWKVKYDAISVFWLMTVFAFTFVNRILLLDRMDFLSAMKMSSLAFLMPILGYFGYREKLTDFFDSERYPAIFYGLTLIASAVICGFNIELIIGDISGLSASGNLLGLNFFSVLLMQIAIAFAGLLITLQAKKY